MGSQSSQWLSACWSTFSCQAKKKKKPTELPLICSTLSSAVRTDVGYRGRQHKHADDCQRTERMSSFELPAKFYSLTDEAVSKKERKGWSAETHCPLLMVAERVSTIRVLWFSAKYAYIKCIYYLIYSIHIIAVSIYHIGFTCWLFNAIIVSFKSQFITLSP